MDADNQFHQKLSEIAICNVFWRKSAIIESLKKNHENGIKSLLSQLDFNNDIVILVQSKLHTTYILLQIKIWWFYCITVFVKHFCSQKNKKKFKSIDFHILLIFYFK
jgi:hypothetical protein